MKRILLLTIALLLTSIVAEAQNKPITAKRINENVMGKIDHGKKAQANMQPIQLTDMHIALEAPLEVAFKNRQSIRQFKKDELPIEVLSTLLYSAYGYNRPEDHKRVVPSAINAQEYDIYVFTSEGIYTYDAHKNILYPLVEGDHRAEISAQPHFASAPISIVLVANYDRMEQFKEKADRDFYAAVDCGYISQNIYLYCAAAELGTVACGGINRDYIHKLLNIKNGRAMLAHPVGMK